MESKDWLYRAIELHKSIKDIRNQVFTVREKGIINLKRGKAIGNTLVGKELEMLV